MSFLTGLLAAGAQHQAIFGSDRFNVFGLDALATGGSGYYGDQAMQFAFGNGTSSNMQDGVPLAEIATVMNVADFLDCGIDCSAVDCSAGIDCGAGMDCGAAMDCGAGVDAGGGGDFAFAFAF